MATIEDPKNTAGHLIAASKVSGTSVYNVAGDKLGTVYDVMIDKVSGAAAYAVMSFGGFLGIGDKYHPLPWSMLTYDALQGGYVVDLDRDRLEGAPVYASDDGAGWREEGWDQRIDDYYGVRSAWERPSAI